MKKLFFIIAVLFSFTGYAQTVGQLRYDTVKMYKVGGTTELILQNASSGIVGGVLRNVINGRTVFQAVVDSIYSNATQDSIVYVIAGTRRAFKYSSGGGGSGWGLAGNAITIGDFLGTTNSEDLVFKRNNAESGRIGSTNTSFGNTANVNNTGTYNTVFGFGGLYSNTTGSRNTIVGSDLFVYNTTGSDNVVIGSGSALTHPTGSYNTLIGNGTDISADGTDNAIAIGYGAIASANQLAISSNINQIKATGITGASSSGYVLTTNGSGIATFQASAGGVTLSQLNDSLAAIRDTIQFDGTMNVNTVGQLTTAGVDTSVVATRHYADSVAAASGGGTAIPNNEIAFGNGTGITSNSDFFYSTGSGGSFNVGFSGNVILQKTGNNYYFGDKDGINNQTYLHVNDGSKLVTVNADSLKLGSVKVALQATDSTGSPTNMIYQGADGLLHKAAVPSGSGGSPAGNYGNIQINRNGAFDTPGGDSLSFNESTTTLNVIGGIRAADAVGAETPAPSYIKTTNDLLLGDVTNGVYAQISGSNADNILRLYSTGGNPMELHDDVTVIGNITAHNIIGATATQTDANFSATAGTAYVLSGNNSATRTITMPTLAEGDVFEFYNENTSANKWVSSATIYLSDNTTFTTLADDTNYILRYVGGKLRVSN